MEILEIRSSHDLSTQSPAARRVGPHSYQVNCRQFLTLQRDWQRKGAQQESTLCLMTLGFERIWINEEEAKQVETAIMAKRSPLALD